MRRRRVISAVLGAAFVVLAIAAGVSITAWRHSPTYALRAIATAVRERDRAEFERHVEVDSLIQSFILEFTGDSPLAATAVAAAAVSFRGQMTAILEDGNLNTDSRIGMAVDALRRGETETKLEHVGVNAYFSLPTRTSEGSPFSIRLHMAQMTDGQWRVDRAVNVKEMKTLEDAEEAARLAKEAAELEEKLSKLRVVARLHTSVGGGWHRVNRFQFRFANDSTKPMRSVNGRIRCTQAGFDEAVELNLSSLPPGKSTIGLWNFDVNQFIRPTEAVYAMGESEAVDFLVEAIFFADGTQLARASN